VRRKREGIKSVEPPDNRKDVSMARLTTLKTKKRRPKPDPERAWYGLLDDITENLVEAEWHGLKKENRLRALTWMLVNEIVDDDGEEDDPFGGGFTSEATLRARIQHILNYFAHLIVEQYGVEGEVMKIAEPFPNSDDPRVVKLRAAMIEMLKDPQAWDATRSWVMNQSQQR
jgi:hypothetical protein